MIDNASIESLKNSIDIVDVVGSFIELRKAGANYKAICPFHGEKTPSLVVSPAKQIYHCFGCGAGGDSITFVMELEKLSYPEAIEKLANMFNFSLTYTKGSGDYSEAKRLLEAMKQWYIKNLRANPTALEYLHHRGVNTQSIDRFGIGYVPHGKSVMDFLQQALLPLPIAAQAGIIAQDQSGKGYYARLVERIVFPIYSSNGGLVGFGGRTITNHPAKYINSPQTKLFNKSRLLYGYDLAKERIYKEKRLIICEGYLDVVMLHQAGFTEAVAGMGTALTNDHLPLLRKGDPEIILAYDGDKAGAEAAMKAAQLLAIAGFDGGVVLFSDGEDPADLISNGKREKVVALFKKNKPFIPFIVERMAGSYLLTNPREKERAFGVIQAFLQQLSPIIKEAYIPLASTLLEVNPAMFGRSTTTRAVEATHAKPLVQAEEDTELLGILKTLLDTPQWIPMVMNAVDIEIFGAYSKYFTLLVEGKMTDPLLMKIQLSEEIHLLTEVELVDALRKILIRFYKQKLKLLPREKELSAAKKMFLIRKLRTDIIPRLEKGELVMYEFNL